MDIAHLNSSFYMAENKVCVEVSTVIEIPQSHRIDLQNTLVPKDQGTLQKRG